MLKATRKILLILISNLIIVIFISCSFTKANQQTNLGSVKLTRPLDRSQLHKTVWVSEKFSAIQENHIVNALHTWECATDNLVQFDIHLKFPDVPFILDNSADPEKILVILPSKDDNEHIKNTDVYIKKRDSERYTIGLFYYESDIVPTILLVTGRIGSFEFKGVAEHEIGHSLKIDHTADKNSIMFPHYDESAKKITDIDLQYLCNIYWCDADEFSKNLVSCNNNK